MLLLHAAKSRVLESEDSGKSKQPKFYTLSPTSTDDKTPALDPLAKRVLMVGDGDDLELSDFYKHCLNAMLAGSSLDKAMKV